jgi:cytochrome c oxidase assembly protein subunit 15
MRQVEVQVPRAGRIEYRLAATLQCEPQRARGLVKVAPKERTQHAARGDPASPHGFAHYVRGARSLLLVEQPPDLSPDGIEVRSPDVGSARVEPHMRVNVMLNTMAQRMTLLRRRAGELTVTPAQYALAAYVAMGAFTLIVLSGAAVRLTGSGLGCPRWPRCYGKVYPPLNAHALIEFSNRMVTIPVTIAALAAFALALRRRPHRRDLVWLSALLPLGVLAQAVLGGLTVRGALDYGWVMGHFALSMLVLAAAVALVWRSAHEPGERPRVGDRALVLCARVTVALGGVTIFAGTAATAAGPHAGGSPGQRINRLAFDGKGTMDFVIHRHGEIAVAFGLAALGVWWLARRSGPARPVDPLVRRSATAMCALIALQGLVGLDQYKTHLPTELVWVHVSLASLTWLAVLWTAFAAGRLQPHAVPSQERQTAPPALST